MKLVTVIGARPQFIKAAAVSRAIRKATGIREIIVHTGQHYDRNMSDVFFEEMEIPRPDYFLDIHGMNHGAMTGQMLEKTEEVLLKESPDAVLVYGDTNTTLAGALAAVKLHVPVAHVEAGLRSFNRRMPEEINRVMADHLSTLLFCPTDAATANLSSEGIQHGKGGVTVARTGDVMLDAALHYGETSREKAKTLAPGGELAQKIQNTRDGFLLCTVHRAENTDDPKRLAGIFNALARLSEKTPVALPLHPRTQKLLDTHGMRESAAAPGLWIIEPVGYFDMLELLKACRLVLTDSGGLQKEAFFFKKPCVTLRDETEWVELVAHGVNTLTGADPDRIAESALAMLEKALDFSAPLYGHGDASGDIVRVLRETFQGLTERRP
jgi:UDP-GlcNAc3NAcA epimerase